MGHSEGKASSVTVSYRRPDDLSEVTQVWPVAGVDELAAAAPWRSFRWYRGQKHYSGTYWSSTVGGHVIYESRLELARLLFADFDAEVRHIVAQPFLLRARVNGKMRRHVPDYLLIEDSGPVVVDVKPARPANMARWAHHHQIPLRSRGGPSHTATLTADKAARGAPALLRPALAGIGGAERLARFAAATRYPTVTRAAAMKLHQGVLQHQINRLAADLGGPLLTRAQRDHPMTTTPLGRRVLRAWHRWTEPACTTTSQAITTAMR